MPVKRRMERQRRPDLLTNRRILCKLLAGHDFSILSYALGTQENRASKAELDALRALWEEVWSALRDQLIDWHVHGTAPDGLVSPPRPARPGSRPWGFWQFDDRVPKPRPAIRFDHPRGFAVVHADGTEETELAFLRRHRLLTPDEEAATAAK